jgi:hypothetical protein
MTCKESDDQHLREPTASNVPVRWLDGCLTKATWRGRRPARRNMGSPKERAGTPTMILPWSSSSAWGLVVVSSALTATQSPMINLGCCRWWPHRFCSRERYGAWRMESSVNMYRIWNLNMYRVTIGFIFNEKWGWGWRAPVALKKIVQLHNIANKGITVTEPLRGHVTDAYKSQIKNGVSRINGRALPVNNSTSRIEDCFSEQIKLAQAGQHCGW